MNGIRRVVRILRMTVSGLFLGIAILSWFISYLLCDELGME